MNLVATYRRLVTACAAALLVASGSPAAAAREPALGAVADDLRGVSCAFTSSLTVTPGLSMTPRDVLYAEHFVLDPCYGPAGGMISLTGAGKVMGTAHGSCILIPDGQSFTTIAWSDGTASVLRAEAFALPPFAKVRGAVASGRGVGTPFNLIALLAPVDPPSACITDDGLRRATPIGYWTFG